MKEALAAHSSRFRTGVECGKARHRNYPHLICRCDRNQLFASICLHGAHSLPPPFWHPFRMRVIRSLYPGGVRKMD